ncbi:neural proliferation differentiation and control protein 1-like [Notolabrus celidotus]|uniref:neural proliferation differentiation and control protein 1-like n=1 Tax=Notolabrus celidotus TaxID=1203425 RepID=UPI00148FB745|nr:neural proliferation differentiation and control protein 1-like [Notolabrus celidotus]
MLLSSPRNGPQRRASLLLFVVVVVCAIPVSRSLPAHHKCPPPLDCAEEGREFCKPGSSYCGPCLHRLVENDEGFCVARSQNHHKGKVSNYPNLDDEIDYLHSIIEKQVVSEVKSQKQQNRHPATAASQTDAQKSKTDASKQKQKNQGQLSHENHTTTAAPPPAVSALETPTTQPGATEGDGRAGPLVEHTSKNSNGVLIILISLFVAVGAIGMIIATVCLVKLKKESRLAQKVDYPAFKGSGPPPAATNSTSSGDTTLAQSAQMYHYQHQKQQMLSVGNHKPEQKTVDTEVTSDEEEVGGDFTVYECPGLAPTGEMEVKNPLFDDSTLHYQGNQK